MRQPFRVYAAWRASLPGKKCSSRSSSSVSGGGGGVLPIPLLLARLKSCTAARDLAAARSLHSAADRSGAIRNLKVASSLINLYSKCAALPDAIALFNLIPDPDSICWNTLLVAHTDNNLPTTALHIFSRMQTLGCHPDSLTFLAAIKACIALAADEPGVLLNHRLVKLNSLKTGQEIHLQALSRGCHLHSDVKLHNTLVDFYAACGCISDAFRVFWRMPCHSVVSWTVLILGCAENGEEEVAVRLFESSMPEEGRDGPLFLAAIKACTRLCEKEEEEKGDGRLVKVGILEKVWGIHSRPDFTSSDMILMNALVDVYAKCRCMLDARRVFDRMRRHDVVSWTSLILGYVENGEAEVALKLFSGMRALGCCPNSLTLVAVFKACSSLAEAEPSVGSSPVKFESLNRGRHLHALASDLGLDSDLLVINTLVSMYASCGSMIDARRVFETVTYPDPVLWTSLMLGYAENFQGAQALEIFTYMNLRGIPQEPRTLAAALKACGSLADLQLCKALHSEVCRLFSLENDVVLATSLVDCYSKCGSMTRSQLVFDSACPNSDSVSFTAIMSGYGRQGDCEAVFRLFRQMRSEEVDVSSVTFLCLLTACSHAGLVEKGKRCLEVMKCGYGVEAGVEHYVCVVDLLGRANEIGEALRVVEGMPVEFRRRSIVWMVLLGACHKWKNVEVGKIAYEALQELGEHDPSVFELMSGIYKQNS